MWPDSLKIVLSGRIRHFKKRILKGRGFRGGSDEKMRRMWVGLEIDVVGLPPLGETYEPKLNARNSKVQKEEYGEIIFNRIARENIPEGELRTTEQQQSSAATSDTLEQFSIYPTLPHDNLNMELDMEEGNQLE